MTSDMELVVDAGGGVRCVYGEELDLREIGRLQITRASHVEPDRDGNWWADMGPVDGPVLGPFRNRTEALQAEREWLSTPERLAPLPVLPHQGQPSSGPSRRRDQSLQFAPRLRESW